MFLRTKTEAWPSHEELSKPINVVLLKLELIKDVAALPITNVNEERDGVSCFQDS